MRASPWIAGEPLGVFDESVLTQIFDTTVNLELRGLLEWDLCPGNILDDGADITLIDFGFCYPFDPLTEYNSAGLDAPMFHGVERLETRNFFGFLLKREVKWPMAQTMSLFELEKRLACAAYARKHRELRRRGATQTILSWIEAMLQKWQRALVSPANLEDLYVLA